MKKIFTLMLTAIFALVLVTTASAAQFKDAVELYWSWVDENYPEYVTGVWSTYGDMNNLTIGVLNNEVGEAGKAEMLELIERDSSITFVYQDFPRLLLMEIMDELNSYIERGLAFSHGGLYDPENRVKITLDINKKNDPTSEAIKAEMIEKYGDAIIFDYGELLYSLEYTGEIGALALTEPENGFDMTMLFILVAIASLFTLTMVLVLKRQKTHTLQTAEGSNVTTQPITNKDIEALIRSSDIDFPKKLDEKIMNEIK
ncbi:MAG: hypothetical protein IJZ89_02720 [Clostridia bacterium]|nr:hypothetical protein [Clostridia bacterium]